MNFFHLLLFLVLVSLSYQQDREIYGNFSSQQLSVIRNLIEVGEKKFLPSTNYSEMARFISQYLTQSLAGGYYWNVFVFQPGLSNVIIANHPYKKQFYIHISKPTFNLTYVIWSNTAKSSMTFWECIDPTKQQFGLGLDNSMILRVQSLIEQALIYKGDNIQDNAQYIRDKLTPGTWPVLITDKGTRFYGYGYESKNKEYAILENYGIMNWGYIIYRER